MTAKRDFGVYNRLGAGSATDESEPKVPVRGQTGPEVAPDNEPVAPISRRDPFLPQDPLFLTRAQIEVLKLYPYSGGTWKDVARVQGRSEQTVRNHVTSAFRRLGANNITEAYIRLGWLRVPKR